MKISVELKGKENLDEDSHILRFTQGLIRDNVSIRTPILGSPLNIRPNLPTSQYHKHRIYQSYERHQIGLDANCPPQL